MKKLYLALSLCLLLQFCKKDHKPAACKSVDSVCGVYIDTAGWGISFMRHPENTQSGYMTRSLGLSTVHGWSRTSAVNGNFYYLIGYLGQYEQRLYEVDVRNGEVTRSFPLDTNESDYIHFSEKSNSISIVKAFEDDRLRVRKLDLNTGLFSTLINIQTHDTDYPVALDDLSDKLYVVNMKKELSWLQLKSGKLTKLCTLTVSQGEWQLDRKDMILYCVSQENTVSPTLYSVDLKTGVQTKLMSYPQIQSVLFSSSAYNEGTGIITLFDYEQELLVNINTKTLAITTTSCSMPLWNLAPSKICED